MGNISGEAGSREKHAYSQLSLPSFLLFLLLIIFPACGNVTTQKVNCEILWDNYGVPHIYADNASAMYYAFGWAQMNNHANLILKLYAQSRGIASEYFGREYFESDKRIHLFQLNELAEKSYKRQNGEYKSYLDAFVNGINDYALKNRDAIGDEFRQVLPVTVSDVISHTIRVTCLEFLAGEDIGSVKRLTEPGSNAIAIAPSRSASGKSMLLTNPHLPWSDFFTWFEAHLNTDGFSVYGISLVGMPSVTMAFNNDLGWAHTVNPIDGSDRYELKLENGGYLLDGRVVPFEKRSVLIKVKQADGSVIEQKAEFSYSKHGPVVGQKGNIAYSVRIAGLNNSAIFEQYHKMGKARNRVEFENALSMLQNPMFNVIYADREGNILYVFNGNVPVRDIGDFAFWRGTIDGTDSRLIWQKTHPYSDLPRVLNPASGFIQNCNDPPWTCTWPAVINPSQFPLYMAPTGMGFRPQRAVNLLKDNYSVTFDDLIGYKMNTGLETADRFLDELLIAGGKSGKPEIRDAVKVLEIWDRKADSASKGAVLFSEWWDRVNREMFEIPWSPDQPVTTPSGIKDTDKAVDLLSKAAESTLLKYGRLDVSVGDLFRLRMGGSDYASNGGPEFYGILGAVYYADDKDGKKRAVAGDTYIAVAEFGTKVRAVVSLGYGNATQPGNKHVGDQLKMMSEKKLRPALLEKEEILREIERKEHLPFNERLFKTVPDY